VRMGESTHDPLTVNAVVFDDDDIKVALVSCDLCALPDEIVRNAQTDCESKLGIKASSVIISCTQTHLAPCTLDFLPGWVDKSFMKHLNDAIVQAAG
jgi:hypothetical protein